MKKRIFSLLLSIFLIATLIVPVSAYTPSSFEVSAEAALLISLDGNGRIYEKEPDKQMYPAALVKIMTSVIILEKTTDVAKEQVPVTETVLDDLFGISYNAYGFTAGETLTPKDLISAIMLASSNEAANIAAEYYGGGSIEKFVQMMNDKAAELGMENTHYTNATGFHDDNQYTTANDLFKLVKYAMQDDRFKELVSPRLYTMEGTELHPSTRYILNANWLLDSATEYYYRYATGVKNGNSEEAGRCLAATATKDKKTYVCILLGCPREDKDGKDIYPDYIDAKNLFDWAFTDFQHKTVVDTTQPVCEAKVKYSSDTDYVTLYPADDLSATIPKTADNSTIQITPVLDAEEFTAPIEKGQVMGHAVVTYAGTELGQVDLVASDEVGRSFWLAAWGEIGKFMMTPWFLGILGVLIALLVFRHMIVKANRKKKKTRRVKDYRRM